MQFGIREICDVVFKAKNAGNMGSFNYVAGQPVLYIDSAKTSTMEGAATTVYAQGGKGNARLIAWEGERTLTFTVEDALLSELGFAILSGAGLMKGFKKGTQKYTEKITFTDVEGVITGVLTKECEKDLVVKTLPEGVTAIIGTDKKTITLTGTGATAGDYNVEYFTTETKAMYVHSTAMAILGTNGKIDLSDVLGETEQIHGNAPVFVMSMKHGSMTGMLNGFAVTADGKALQGAVVDEETTVFVDFYIEKHESVTEMTIDMENFAGYYYVEASTLFRRQSDGKDLPAELIFPNVKIQSNFTFSMASTGDPSTFTFTMDAMPGYTRFDRTKKVLCVMQVVDEADEATGVKYDSTDDTPADADLKYPYVSNT